MAHDVEVTFTYNIKANKHRTVIRSNEYYVDDVIIDVRNRFPTVERIRLLEAKKTFSLRDDGRWEQVVSDGHKNK